MLLAPAQRSGLGARRRPAAALGGPAARRRRRRGRAPRRVRLALGAAQRGRLGARRAARLVVSVGDLALPRTVMSTRGYRPDPPPLRARGYTRPRPRADGGIGRRARLRAWSGITGWRFESSSAHSAKAPLCGAFSFSGSPPLSGGECSRHTPMATGGICCLHGRLHTIEEQSWACITTGRAAKFTVRWTEDGRRRIQALRHRAGGTRVLRESFDEPRRATN